MKRISAALFLCALASAAIAEETVNVRLVSDAVAHRIVRAALDYCTREGYFAAAVFVARDGVPQAMLRHALAPPVAVDIARKKAYTAANMRLDPAELSVSLARSHRQLARLPGGRILEAAGYFYGGVGVSGAPGKVDSECAQAGIDAVRDDLEFE